MGLCSTSQDNPKGQELSQCPNSPKFEIERNVNLQLKVPDVTDFGKKNL